MTSVTTNGPMNRSQPSAGGDARTILEASPGQVRQWLDAGEAVLVDVREPDEYAREHISGAQLIPLSVFDPARAAALAKRGQKLVMQCRSGRRSADACRMALSKADPALPIFTMTGGIEAWKQSKLPVTINTKVSVITVMRQVQLVIGLGVLGGCALAWFVNPMFIGIPAFLGAGLTFAGATGTCALASLIGMMPWNKAAARPSSCATGSCG